MPFKTPLLILFIYSAFVLTVLTIGSLKMYSELSNRIYFLLEKVERLEDESLTGR